MTTQVFKRGDTFNLNLLLADTDENLALPLNDPQRAVDLTGYTFTSKAKRNEDGADVATFTCTVLSQTTQKGWLNIKSAADTKMWPLGLVKMDIKGVKDGVTQHSETLTFQVIDGVTD